jgi:HicA toxin of bacterial toxin-antitoxin,
MSKTDKLLKRFLAKPKDFTYDELKKLLRAYGYEEAKTGKTSGSRVTFYNRETTHIIKFHKAHPVTVMKKYQLDEIENRLKEKGVIK